MNILYIKLGIDTWYSRTIKISIKLFYLQEYELNKHTWLKRNLKVN